MFISLISFVYIHVYLIGLRELGKIILERFKWGHAFYSLNEELLDLYAGCKTSDEVVTEQHKYMDMIKHEDEQRRNKGTVNGPI